MYLVIYIQVEKNWDKKYIINSDTSFSDNAFESILKSNSIIKSGSVISDTGTPLDIDTVLT